MAYPWAGRRRVLRGGMRQVGVEGPLGSRAVLIVSHVITVTVVRPGKVGLGELARCMLSKAAARVH